MCGDLVQELAFQVIERQLCINFRQMVVLRVDSLLHTTVCNLSSLLIRSPVLCITAGASEGHQTRKLGATGWILH